MFKVTVKGLMHKREGQINPTDGDQPPQLKIKFANTSFFKDTRACGRFRMGDESLTFDLKRSG